jgi:hypothetical protein
MVKRRYRNKSGASLVELAVAICFGLPVIFTMIYAWMEVSFVFTARTNLDAATRRAAQLLINQFEINSVQAPNTTNGNLPAGLAFDIRTGNGQYFVKSDANQFTWTWDLTDRPATITVTTSFPTDGSTGLVTAPFDPLHIRDQMKTICTSATFPVPQPN